MLYVIDHFFRGGAKLAILQMPDEYFAAVQHLSAEKGLSPEEYVQALVREALRRDQLAFWGPDLVDEIERDAQPHERLASEEFLAALASVMNGEVSA